MTEDSRSGADRRRGLAVPRVEAATFRRNLVQLATCELRFPVLLGYEKDPPRTLHQKLRKAYPHYKREVNVTLHPGQGSSEEPRFFFRSKKHDWTVTFRSTAIAIETKAYLDYEGLRKRLDEVVSSASDVIDSDFFTRVGLRYVNVMPVGQRDAQGWVNPDLAAPLVNGVWGDVDQVWQEVRGVTDEGQYTLRHGYPELESGYVLDLDMYRTDVEVADLYSVLATLNADAYSLFSWCVGPKARDYMQSEGKESAG